MPASEQVPDPAQEVLEPDQHILRMAINNTP